MKRPFADRFVSLVVVVGLAAAIPTAVSANSAPVVTNVVATQIAGTGQVRVTFDVSDADGDQVTARLICSSDNGANFDLLPVTLSGDVNHAMAAGPGKQLIWNAAADYPGRFWSQVVAKVAASDGPATAGEMVAIPAGNFTMGSSATGEAYPTHQVTLSAYSIDKYEVTNAEFQHFIDAGGYSTKAYWSTDGWNWRTGNSRTMPASWGSDAYHTGTAWPGFPAGGVSWYEAEAYANFVGKRLPTEAEWEYAARGTDQRSYPWGENLAQSRANYLNSNDPYGTSTPSGFYNGQYFPNPAFQTTDSPGPFGTYDQAGNVAEWVSDWYAPYGLDPLTDPRGPPNSTGYKIVRGGSWASNGGLAAPYLDLRAFARSNVFPTGAQAATPDMSSPDVGFRCAKSNQ